MSNTSHISAGSISPKLFAPMPPGLRTHKQASLRVAIPTGVPEDMRDRMRELVSVVSEDRGKGHAKALMHQVTAEADRSGFVLLLTVEPFAEGMTLEQLEKFYAAFNFVRIQDEPVLMARQPEKPIIANGRYQWPNSPQGPRVRFVH